MMKPSFGGKTALAIVATCALGACGQASAEGAGAGGGGSGAISGVEVAGGSGNSAGVKGGATAGNGATANGGTTQSESGGTSGGVQGASGGASAGATQNAIDPALCAHQDGFIEVTGTLPGFGKDVSLRSGCIASRVGSYPKPASFTGAHVEGRATVVTLVACSDDQSLEFEIDLETEQYSPTDGWTEHISGQLSFKSDGLVHSISIPTFVETQRPVDSWRGVGASSVAGIGKAYSGTFVGEPGGGSDAVSVTGSFLVCHVANFGNDGA
jgi:hypothetical protein